MLACLAGTAVAPTARLFVEPVRGVRALVTVGILFVVALLAGSAAARWIALPAPQWLAVAVVAGVLISGRRTATPDPS